jgi:prephenate dehydratase
LSLALYPSNIDAELSKLLQCFAYSNLELLKLESHTIKGQPWQYCLCLDLRAYLKREQINKILEDLQNQGYKLHCLGFYPEMKLPNKN